MRRMRRRGTNRPTISFQSDIVEPGQVFESLRRERYIVLMTFRQSGYARSRATGQMKGKSGGSDQP